MISGEAQLKGVYGFGLLEDLPDVYNKPPYPPHEPLIPITHPSHPAYSSNATQPPTDIAARRRYVCDNTAPFSGRYQFVFHLEKAYFSSGHDSLIDRNFPFLFYFAIFSKNENDLENFWTA